MGEAKAETEAERTRQIRAVEELLFAGPQKLGVAKGLFLGRFIADWVMPYPQIPADQAEEVERAVGDVRQFLDEHLDPATIDRQADIPREVIAGLGKLGVLGM